MSDASDMMLAATTLGVIASSASARRKSCVACTRSKRRCDLGLPRCSRCDDRDIDCVYTPSASTRKRKVNLCPKTTTTSITSNSTDSITTTTPSNPEGYVEQADDTAMKDFNMDLTDTNGIILETDLIFDCPSSLPSFLHDFHYEHESNNKLALAPVPRAFVDFPEDFDTLQALINARTSYTLDQFRKAPSSMVRSCSTPWTHHKLYNNEAHGQNMPRSLAIAQACCALDMARNKDNNMAITRNIIARARELCAETTTTTTDNDGADTRPLIEILATTQALLLYHIMLHFNASPLARDTIPLTARHLESSVKTLHYRTVSLSSPYPLGTTRSPRINNKDFICQPVLPPPPHPISLDPVPPSSTTSPFPSSSHPTTPKQLPVYLPLTPLTHTRAHFHDFILHESSRRTVLMSAIFLVLQGMLDIPPSTLSSKWKSSLPKPHCAQEYCLNPWTLSQTLWTAEDTVDFAIGWNAGRGVVLDCVALEQHIPSLNPEEVDTFSKMILTALLGVDETKGWLLAKGGVVL